jgi:hypothetical protein
MFEIQAGLPVDINPDLIRLLQEGSEQARSVRVSLGQQFIVFVFANTDSATSGARDYWGIGTLFSLDTDCAVLKTNHTTLDQHGLCQNRWDNQSCRLLWSFENPQFHQRKRKPLPCMALKKFGQRRDVIANAISNNGDYRSAPCEVSR